MSLSTRRTKNSSKKGSALATMARPCLTQRRMEVHPSPGSWNGMDTKHQTLRLAPARHKASPHMPLNRLAGKPCFILRLEAAGGILWGAWSGLVGRLPCISGLAQSCLLVFICWQLRVARGWMLQANPNRPRVNPPRHEPFAKPR